MKQRGVLGLLLLWLLAGGWPLGLRGAEWGTLQCLRSGHTNDLVVCLGCHDGSLARNFALKSAAPHSTTPTAGHPVPVDYAAAYARRPREFVPPASLSLPLVRGEVQCVSCHRINARGDWLLLTVAGGRSLCLGCHRK